MVKFISIVVFPIVENRKGLVNKNDVNFHKLLLYKITEIISFK